MSATICPAIIVRESPDGLERIHWVLTITGSCGEYALRLTCGVQRRKTRRNKWGPIVYGEREPVPEDVRDKLLTELHWNTTVATEGLW